METLRDAKGCFVMLQLNNPAIHEHAAGSIEKAWVEPATCTVYEWTQ